MVVWFAVALVFGRRFQFSLRSLLVLVVVVALPCSWLAVEMKNAKRQEQTIQAIEGTGGHVYYDCECDDSGILRLAAEPAAPGWLLHLFGKDQFATVVQAVVDSELGLDCTKDLHGLQFLLVGTDKSPQVLQLPPGGPLILSGHNTYSGGDSPFGPVMTIVDTERLKHLVDLPPSAVRPLG